MIMGGDTTAHDAIVRGGRLAISGPHVARSIAVSGRSELSFEERIELELYYAQNWSFWLDLRILFKTIGVVIKKTGAK